MSTTTTDPIADMLTRIRNAIGVNKSQVTMQHSNIKENIAKLLKANGFIDDVVVEKANIGKQLKLVINNDDQNARITELVRLSSPGRRHYAGVSEIPKVKQGRGMVIISTSQGLMT